MLNRKSGDPEAREFVPHECESDLDFTLYATTGEEIKLPYTKS